MKIKLTLLRYKLTQIFFLLVILSQHELSLFESTCKQQHLCIAWCPCAHLGAFSSNTVIAYKQVWVKPHV